MFKIGLVVLTCCHIQEIVGMICENKCINIHQCNPIIKFLQNERQLKPPAITFLKAYQCGFDNKYPKICCDAVSRHLPVFLSNRDGVTTTNSPPLLMDRSAGVVKKLESKCATRDEVCVEIQKCPVFSELSKRPRRSHLVKLFKRHHCGFEGAAPKICCSSVHKLEFVKPKNVNRPTKHPPSNREDVRFKHLRRNVTHRAFDKENPRAVHKEKTLEMKTRLYSRMFDDMFYFP